MLRGSGLRRLTRTTAIVTTGDGQVFRGVVINVYGDSIALAQVSVLLGEAQQQLVGEVLIPLENISFIQRALP